MTSDFATIAKVLATSGITPSTYNQLDSALQSMDEAAKSLKINYACLLAPFIWPLIVVALPTGCCISYIVCLMGCTITLFVVGILWATGFIFYAGPMAGNIPQQATTVVASLVDSMTAISNETFNTIYDQLQSGKPKQARMIINSMSHVVTLFGGIVQQLQELMEHSRMSKPVAYALYNIRDSISSHLNTLTTKSLHLSAHLPTDASAINETLNSFMNHLNFVVMMINQNQN